MIDDYAVSFEKVTQQMNSSACRPKDALLESCAAARLWVAFVGMSEEKRLSPAIGSIPRDSWVAPGSERWKGADAGRVSNVRGHLL